VKLAAAALLVLALPAQAQMYKCVDEEGKVNYRDQSGPGCKPVDIRASPPMSGSLQRPTEDLATRDAQLRRRQLERDDAAAKDRVALEERLRRCQDLRIEAYGLGSGVPIYSFNEKGEKMYMEDAARERRLAAVRDNLRGCP
jgi:hypothetical protein